MGRGSVRFRVVRLGGVADVRVVYVFMYRDSSIAPLFDPRRRIQAVMDVLDSMIRSGVSLPLSVELTVQWDKILSTGPVYPVTLDDLQSVREGGVSVSVSFVGLLETFIHCRLTDFVHRAVVHRREETKREWRIWLREDLLIHPFSGGGLTWFLVLLFFTVNLILFLVVLVCLLILLGLTRNSERLGFPSFCRSGQREASLEEFAEEVDGWLPLLPETSLLEPTGEMLADVVRRKGATAGSLDGWVGREMKALPVAWYVARILIKVEEIGVWPEGLHDAYIAMILKADGDTTPLGQRPLIVLPVVYRIWASARMVQLEEWFRSLVPDSVVSAVVVAVRLRLGIQQPWTLRRFFLGLLTLISIYLWLMLLSILTLLIEASWIGLQAV